MSFDFSHTYLYKMHKLTTSLDTVFDKALRHHASIGLSQFTLLLSVQQHQPALQRSIASFLMVSPGAISRQVELARQRGWIRVTSGEADRRTQHLTLTASGEAMIQTGLAALESHVFSIFDKENVQTNLMGHIDLLQSQVNTIAKK